jgi:hypothetical protein
MAIDPVTGIDMSGSADQIAADVMAAEWAEWENTFKPIELAALQQSSLVNPQVLTDAVSKAQSTAQGTYAAMPGMLQRRQKGMGIAPTAEQTMASNRIMNVEGAQATAGAMNKARADVAAEDEQLLLGSMPKM